MCGAKAGVANGHSGRLLLKRIRALPADAGGSTPVAAVTAYASEQDRAKALASGFATHISKPFDPVDLVTLAARYARKS